MVFFKRGYLTRIDILEIKIFCDESSWDIDVKFGVLQLAICLSEG